MNDQKFFTVFAFDHTRDDFAIQGIFSEQSAADALTRDLEAKRWTYLEAACTQRLAMDQIKTILTAEALGAVVEPLKELLSACGKPIPVYLGTPSSEPD